jgi:NADH dehydrogenase
MADRLITIFGGAGFIGRHLAHRLAARGDRLRVISRQPSLCGHLQPMGAVGQIVVQTVDLQDEAALKALLAGTDGVVNLIGILAPRGRATFEAVQGELPARLARAAAAAGVGRMVQVSAIGAAAKSASAYARSKAQGEAGVRAAMAGAVVLRPSIVIGPEDQFFNRFAAMVRIAPGLPLIGGGRTRFQPVYVGDVADALVAALARDDAAGRTYELGGPKIYSFAELMRYMLSVIGRRRLLVPVSFKLARLPARLLELLPDPPLTRDQIELLKHDNVVDPAMPGLAELGVPATPIELVVPDYLARYRALPAEIARS